MYNVEVRALTLDHLLLLPDLVVVGECFLGAIFSPVGIEGDDVEEG